MCMGEPMRQLMNCIDHKCMWEKYKMYLKYGNDKWVQCAVECLYSYWKLVIKYEGKNESMHKWVNNRKHKELGR